MIGREVRARSATALLAGTLLLMPALSCASSVADHDIVLELQGDIVRSEGVFKF